MYGRRFWRRLCHLGCGLGLLVVVAGGAGRGGISGLRAQPAVGTGVMDGGSSWPPAVLVDVSGAAYAGADSLNRHPDRVAQHVRVTGVAPGAAGRTLRWSVAHDPLGGLDWEIDRTVIGADGTFEVQGMFRETMPTTLTIDYYSGTLFVTPGETYRLRFHPYDYTLDRRMNVFFPGAPVPSLTFDIERPSAERLNRGIWAFLELYGQEIDEAAYEAITVYGKTAPVSRLKARTDSLSAVWWEPEVSAGSIASRRVSDTVTASVAATRRDTVVRDFVTAYWRYQLAGLEDFAGLKNGKALFRDYLQEAPLLYRQPAQQQFARAYFGAYFDTKCPIPEKRLKTLLAGADVQAVLDTLGVDAALVNRQWREWVYIMAVAEVLGQSGYPAAALERQLAQLAERTVYPMHRQTIAGILENRRRQAAGVALKPYRWTDMAGRAVAADTLLTVCAGKDGMAVGTRHDTAGRWTYVCLVKSDPTLSPEGSAQVYALVEALRRDAGLRAGGRGLVLVCDDDSAAARTYVRALQAALQPPASDTADGQRTGTGQPTAGSACAASDGALSFYHFNREIGNLRDWEVYTFPAFVLISPEGRIYRRFAPPVPDGLNAWRALMRQTSGKGGEDGERRGTARPHR